MPTICETKFVRFTTAKSALNVALKSLKLLEEKMVVASNVEFVSLVALNMQDIVISAISKSSAIDEKSKAARLKIEEPIRKSMLLRYSTDGDARSAIGTKLSLESYPNLGTLNTVVQTMINEGRQLHCDWAN